MALTKLFNEVKVSQIVDTDSSLNTLYGLIKGRVHHSRVVYQHIQLLELGGEGTHKVRNALEGRQIQQKVAHLGKQFGILGRTEHGTQIILESKTDDIIKIVPFRFWSSL